MMKKQVSITFITMFFFLSLLEAQERTHIEDSNFLIALDSLGIDVNYNDKNVLTADIKTLTVLNVFNKNISDLTGIEDFESLELLNCSNNSLTNLDLSYNLNLIELNCSSNNITGADLKVSSNQNLKKLYCSDNLISNLELAKNEQLEILEFTNNLIVTIDLSQNDSLKTIKASNNRFTSLNISTQIVLEELEASKNQLKSLDVSNNALLKNLLISSNQITDLDLKEKDSLLILDVSNNQIGKLELNTSHLLTNLTASDNELIDLDLSKLDSLTILGLSDNQLKTLEISNNLKLEHLIAANNQLTNIDYSENMSLKEIDVSTNLTTSFNLEKNDSITSINFAFNQLSKIDVSANLLLKNINVSNNQIMELDLSENDSITSLYVSNNNLTNLNLKNGNNSALATLITSGNENLFCIQIDDINQLRDGWIKDVHTNYYDDLTTSSLACIGKTYVPDEAFELALIAMGLDDELDNYVLTSVISSMTELDVSGRGISNLTGLESFTSLEVLDCSDNLISNLELITHTNVIELTCKNNLINLLFLKNSILEKLDATENLNLTCVIVDDVDIAKGNDNWKVDDANLYKLECSINKTYVPDDQFEQALIDLGVDSGPLDDYVYTDMIKIVDSLKLQKKNISDLTGIEDFKALKYLNCSQNNLVELKIFENVNLLELVCFSNYLTELDVSKNTNLLFLNVGDNQLNSLDVTENKILSKLECDKNNLTDLDVDDNRNLRILNINYNHISKENIVSENYLLTQFLCSSNEFKKIDVSQNSDIVKFDFSNNFVENINLNNNPELQTLDASLNLLTELDVERNVQLSTVKINSNYLKFLVFNNHSSLNSLSCDNNQIQKSNDANIPDGLILIGADKLKYLSASDNELSQIKLNNNKELVSLDVSGNMLKYIDVSQNTKLVQLYCEHNELDQLIVDKNTALEFLKSSYNQIKNHDLSKNIFLREISSSDNLLTELDLILNDSLRTLTIDNNQIKDIDLSENLLLQDLSFSGNKIEHIDLSLNTELIAIQAGSNSLQSIYLKNGNNENLKTFTISNNLDLSCIEVDNVAFAEANEDWLKDEKATYSENCYYLYTYVPDENFENDLATFDDVPNDNYVPTANIENLTELNVSNKNISDLTGIEDFINLETIDVSNNKLDSLNLVNNTELSSINCSNNNLKTLELNEDTEVLGKIFNLNIASNQFNEFDWSGFSLLHVLDVSSNKFTDLDLIQNESLTSLDCSFNKLVTLNLKNGFNESLETMNASSNGDLVCIEIDDISSNIFNNWLKDDIATFSENCHYYEVYVPDDAFEQALIDAGYDYEGTGTLDDYVPEEKIIKATNLNLSNKGIINLTGLEAFVNLGLLNIQDNEIETIDLSGHLNLIKLYCSNNLFTSLDLSKNELLEELKCASNNLTELDLSNNQFIRELNIDANPITDLALQNLSVLEIFNGSNTEITNLNLASNVNLEKLRANNNMNLISVNIQSGYNEILQSVNLQSNPLLNCILVDNKDAAYNNVNWIKDNIAGYKLICDDDDNDNVSNAEDQCPSTPFGDFVDLFGCSIFSLPIDNFSILVTDETCRNSDNGKINIESKEIYNFIATISNSDYFHSVNFGATTEIRNLKSGLYELCIAIDDKPGFKNCYEIVIGEPDDLLISSSISKTEETISLNMAGGSNYHIDLNGMIFNTSESFITLNLKKGMNKVKIKTDADCQGIYEKSIFISENLVYYPNPFEEHINISIGKDTSKEVIITIYSNLGQVMLSNTYKVQNGLIKIDSSHLETGIYSVSLKSENNHRTFKILKK